ncbi:hypothetical protein Dxin01_00105 [Deinococcus xinjiangensis]|uniref:ERF superfamily protein n=1 Tax=Deinococcus xinjiangensis TaxID=457454 RepID=A0ABP9V5A1_9DEIO
MTQYQPSDIASAHKALVKAQQEFDSAIKDSTNPAFKSKYAALDACVEAVQGALNNNGLFLMQRPGDGGDKSISVTTVFLHESGVEIDGGTVSLPAAKQDPQGYGSALTYARRYGLLAACGIAPENDDDGNSAVQALAQQTKKNAAAYAGVPDAPKVSAGGEASASKTSGKTLTAPTPDLSAMSVEALREQMNTLATKAKGTRAEEGVSKLIKDSAAAGGVSKVSELPKDKFIKVIQSAQELVATAAQPS